MYWELRKPIPVLYFYKGDPPSRYELTYYLPLSGWSL